MTDSLPVRRCFGSAALSIALLVAVACSDGSQGASPSTEAPTTTQPAEAPTTAAPTTAAPTTVATTVADTVVETLPRPEAPPPPDLSLPDSRIGRIALPSIGIDKPLYSGVSLPTLDKGPGHWPGTAMPGRLGNVVVAGHRVSHDRPFYDIDKLKKGDEIVFTIDGGTYVYLVTKLEIVDPDALWIVSQTPTKTATLFACHPKGSTKKRIVAFADYAPEKSSPAV